MRRTAYVVLGLSFTIGGIVMFVDRNAERLSTTGSVLAALAVTWLGQAFGVHVFRRLSSPGFPRVSELLSFLLGPKTRRQIFDPAYNDLMAAHLRAQEGRFQTLWVRRWINFCFGFRTALLLLECAIVGVRRLLTPRGLDRLWEKLVGPR